MEKQFIRLILAISIDGKIAFPNQEEKHLGSRKDKGVLEEGIAWSDATLVGGRTIRIHKKACLIYNKKLINSRLSAGKKAQPISIIVSNKKDFSKEWEYFRQPIERWLLTSKQAFEAKSLESLFQSQIQLQAKWLDTLDELKKKGIYKIALLGGSELSGEFLKNDLIDELQLTIVPKIIGGDLNWAPNKKDFIPCRLSKDESWILKSQEDLGTNEILLRYIRKR